MYTVVTVDDEPLIKKTLRVLIDGYKGAFRVVGEAEDGRAGLFLVEACTPDLVITDLNMPIMTGLEMIEAIRAKGLETEIAVITGYDEFEFARRALRYGVVDYVLKPIRPEAIAGLLDKVLGRKTGGLGAHARSDAEWIARFRTAAKALSDTIWLLDEEGTREAAGRFAAELEEWGRDRPRPPAEAYAALLSFVSSELESRGEAAVPPPDDLESLTGGELRRAAERWFIDLIEAIGRSRHVGNHQGIRQAVAYMEENYRKPSLTLPDAAGIAGMSQAHFSRTFKRETGATFVDYLTALRIAEAKRLLAEGDLRTWEIAEAVGYQEYAHFTKVFRRHTGVTPTDYRRAPDTGGKEGSR